MNDLCRGCQQWQIWRGRQERGFWRSSTVGLRLLAKKNSCHAIKGTMEGWPLHKCASPAGAFKKDERQPLVCPPSSCCKVDSGLCLHCAKSYSKGSLVCSRLLRWRCAKPETSQGFGGKMQTEEPEKQHVMPRHAGSGRFGNISQCSLLFGARLELKKGKHDWMRFKTRFKCSVPQSQIWWSSFLSPH